MIQSQRKCQRCGYCADAANWIGGGCPKCLLHLAVSDGFGNEIHKMPNLPGYRLMNFVGSGGSGVIYKAFQADLSRYVAIKLLNDSASHDPDHRERLLREAQALAKLRHPGIVSLFQVGENEQDLFLVLEFIDGANLRSLLRRASLTIVEKVALFRQLCSALQAAHQAGIVHRDIKPENILVTDDLKLYLTDFGLTKSEIDQNTREQITQAAQLLGTPFYMAPEQLSPGCNIDVRADIYSASVVLYEMLTGVVPVGGYSSLSSFDPQLAPFERIVRKGLSADPAKRYQSISELLAALDLAEKALTGGRSSKLWPVIATIAICLAGYLFAWQIWPSQFADTDVVINTDFVPGLPDWPWAHIKTPHEIILEQVAAPSNAGLAGDVRKGEFKLAQMSYPFWIDMHNQEIICDCNGNGDLSDDGIRKKLFAEGDDDPMHITDVPIKLTDPSETAPSNLVQVVRVKLSATGDELYVRPASYRSGTLNISGQKIPIYLIDRNVNGDYSDDSLVVDRNRNGQIDAGETIEPNESFIMNQAPIQLAVSKLGSQVRARIPRQSKNG